jgi:hypothetical protein
VLERSTLNCLSVSRPWGKRSSYIGVQFAISPASDGKYRSGKGALIDVKQVRPNVMDIKPMDGFAVVEINRESRILKSALPNRFRVDLPDNLRVFAV